MSANIFWVERRSTMKWGLAKRNEEPLFGIEAFRSDIDRLFQDFFSFTPTSLTDSRWTPTVDVEEDEKSVHVMAEVPGIDEKDLSVTIENNLLTIAGEKKEDREEKNGRFVVSERRYGSFRRSVQLPEGISRDGIQATFKNGVLRIEIPREAPVKPSRIKIELK
jgi:HSP20 family protein